MLRRTPATLLCLVVCLLAGHLSQAAPALRIDESRIRLLLEDKLPRVSLELENPAGRAFKARATVELLDPRDAVRASSSTDVEVRRGSNRFALPLSDSAAAADGEFPWYRLRYRVAPAGGEAAPAEGVVAVSMAAPDIFELRVVVPREGRGGSTFRARVRASNPVTQRPASGVAVTARLTADVDDNETVIRAAASTDSEGMASLDFELPRGIDDEGELTVTARRGVFERTVYSSVSFEDRPRVMLTTDKSIYQPGQTMHMRALVLDPSERAAAGDSVTFEVEDEGGTTVFRAEAETTRFGVASADWPVPESARLGSYTVSLEPDDDRYSSDHTARTEVRVSRYELPNFSVSTKGDRPFYTAGQDAAVEVRADYLFGQPVRRGSVRVVRQTERRWNWREQKYETEEGEEVSGALDEQGRFVARLPLSGEHAKLADSAWLRFDEINYAAYVTDPTTNRTEQRRFALRLTKEPLHLYVNEGRYRQAPGLPLAFHVSAFYADGTPAQHCEVSVIEDGPAAVAVGPGGIRHEVKEPGRTILRVRTNRYGVAKVTGPAVRREGPRDKLSLRFVARDREGREGGHVEDFWLAGTGETGPPELRVETDKTLHRPGEPIAVRLSASRPRLSVFVETWSEGRALSSRAVRLADGRASLVIPYSEEFRNGVTVTAISAEPFGGGDEDYAFGARTVVYPRSRELKLDARFSRASFRPGDEAEVKFAVRSSEGRRAESALGVVVFDKAVEERARSDSEFSRPFGFYEGFHGFWYTWASVAGLTRRDIERLDPARAGAQGLDEVADLLYNSYRRDLDYKSFGGAEFEHEQRQVFRRVVGAHLLPLKTALEKSYGERSVYPSDEAALARILSASGVELGALKDPWGQPYRARFHTARDHHHLEITSDGADERAGTEDDFAAETFAWPYFRPVGRRLDRAAADYHERTGGHLRDLPALRAELLRQGFDLDSLRDPWGQPYAFDFGVRGIFYRITARSGGPDKVLQPSGAAGTDDFDLWTTLSDYFAKSRADVDRALDEWTRKSGAFPENRKALADALAKAGIDLKELRDGWGRPAYATFQKLGRYGDRVTMEAGPSGQRTKVRPVTQVVYVVDLRSAGEDGREGTGDDFELARFSSVATEQSAADGSPRAVRPVTTYSGAKGAITGTVKDPNGAVVPGALVKVRHKQTELEFEAKTGEEGIYLLRDLPTGFYRLTCTALGFMSYVIEDVQVQSSSLTQAEIMLSVGGAMEAVSVVAEPSASLNASTATSQTVVRSAGPRFALSTPRLREFFPETLVWQPSVETDRDGNASIRFKLADNITTWKMSVVASTEDGRVGLFEKEILSFQPFFAEHDPPRVLTEGDEISLPVVVRNYLERAQGVQVEMKPESWFALKGPARQQAQAPAGDVARPVFDFRAVSSVADGRQRVTAYGSDASDAVEKPVTVHPDGEERADTSGTVFAGSASLETNVPADAIAGSVRSELKIYPNLTAHLLEGVEAIMQRPYGCGEQTISSAYPSVYVLAYYRGLGGDLEGDLPADIRRAVRYARLGYERLLGYRAPGGGFTYWGRGEADLALTAYALRFLKDASAVIEVDESVVKETRDWLARRQREDGSWHDSPLTTAFVARVFASLQKREPAGKADAASSAALARALRYLAARSEGINEPYLISSYALAASDAGDRAGAARAAERLRSLAREEDGAAYWSLEANTPFYGWGRAGRIETTALAVQALLQGRPAQGEDTLVARGMLFLLRNKDRHGVWLSTQATVNVLDALLALVASDAAARQAAGQAAGDAAEVFVNGKRAGQVALPPPARLSGPVLFDLSPFVAPGANRVEVRRRGMPTQAQAQLVTIYYVPWRKTNQGADPSKPGGGTLRLAVSYDRPTTETGQEVTCSVEAERVGHRGYGMMLAEVGLPPGADVDRASLERAVKETGYAVNSYDVRPDRLVLYLWPTGGGTRLSFKFRPRYGLNALTAPSQIYDYYNPDSRAVLPPTRFVVR